MIITKTRSLAGIELAVFPFKACIGSPNNDFSDLILKIKASMINQLLKKEKISVCSLDGGGGP